MGYLHISNSYAFPAILMFRQVFALEKIHGTSAHIKFKEGNVTFFSGGASHNAFVALFNEADLKDKFTNLIGQPEVTVYGEAYGGSMQGMKATYGPNLKFIVFDVQIGDNWLKVPDAEEVATKLGLEFVSYELIECTPEAFDAAMYKDSVQAIRNGMGEGHKREGVVLRPFFELTTNNGNRIICKHKHPDFAERQNVPKVGANLEVLAATEAIVTEWVTPMRLTHVLDKIPQPHTPEKTGEVIKAMVEDVTREAAGEIKDDKDVRKAIGKAAAIMYKKYLQDAFKEAANGTK